MQWNLIYFHRSFVISGITRRGKAPGLAESLYKRSLPFGAIPGGICTMEVYPSVLYPLPRMALKGRSPLNAVGRLPAIVLCPLWLCHCLWNINHWVFFISFEEVKGVTCTPRTKVSGYHSSELYLCWLQAISRITDKAVSVTSHTFQYILWIFFCNKSHISFLTSIIYKMLG